MSWGQSSQGFVLESRAGFFLQTELRWPKLVKIKSVSRETLGIECVSRETLLETIL